MITQEMYDKTVAYLTAELAKKEDKIKELEQLLALRTQELAFQDKTIHGYKEALKGYRGF